MVKVRDIYQYIDRVAPFATQMDFDNAGLLVGSGDMDVKRVMVALDVTAEVAGEAARKRCQLIVSHHPLIFHPLKAVNSADPIQAVVAQLIGKNIALISAHTNLDVASGGVNDVLMERLGLKSQGVLEEMGGCGLGRWGELPEAMTARDFAAHVKRALGTRAVRAVPGDRAVKKVAVCGGAGGDMVELAARMGMDAYVTADVKHHEFLAAKALGMTLLDAGHYATENPMMSVLADKLSHAFEAQGVEIVCSKAHKEPYFAP